MWDNESGGGVGSFANQSSSTSPVALGDPTSILSADPVESLAPMESDTPHASLGGYGAFVPESRQGRISPLTLYTWMVGLSVATLLISNLASTKMFDFFGTGLVMDGGAVIFPIGYVLGDVIVEFYGYARARRIIILTVSMNLLGALVFLLVGLLPPGEGWENQSAYQAILGFVPRLVLASLVAFLAGQLLNALVFQRLKNTRFGGRFLWWRAIGSSLVGNSVDSLIFTVIAFIGVLPTYQLIGLVGLAFLVKMLGEAFLLPVTYTVVRVLRKAVPTPDPMLTST